MRRGDADYEDLKQTLTRYHPDVMGEGELDDFVSESTLAVTLLVTPLFCPPLTEIHGLVFQCEIHGLVFQCFQWPTTRAQMEADIGDKLERCVPPREIEEEYNLVDVWNLF